MFRVWGGGGGGGGGEGLWVLESCNGFGVEGWGG